MAIIEPEGSVIISGSAPFRPVEDRFCWSKRCDAASTSPLSEKSIKTPLHLFFFSNRRRHHDGPQKRLGTNFTWNAYLREREEKKTHQVLAALFIVFSLSFACSLLLFFCCCPLVPHSQNVFKYCGGGGAHERITTNPPAVSSSPRTAHQASLAIDTHFEYSKKWWGGRKVFYCCYQKMRESENLLQFIDKEIYIDTNNMALTRHRILHTKTCCYYRVPRTLDQNKFRSTWDLHTGP